MRTAQNLGMALATLLATIVVIDGDTVERGGVLYRLLGCDAPETRYAKCQSEYDLGMKATRRLEQLLKLHDGQLILNGKKCGFDRPCAHLFVGPRDACQVLISEGLARPCGGRGCRKSWCD